MSDFRIEGFDEQFRRLAREAGDKRRYDDLRYDVGRKFLDHCAEESPEKTGQLIASFKRRSFDGKKEWILDGKHAESIEAGTKVFYASMLNDGHRLVIRKRNKKGERIRGKRGLKENGFVKGTHFMDKALAKTNQDIPEMVESFLRETGRAAGFDVSG
ncbi:hypothetical protein [Paenibacillus whitsoniae]|uniref:HK97 gp10 family phage protein n=1 Tax=Paenibacillus whitsoniae TaxID=2496558 RepID=A0A430J7W9_9BACL|nr:hypothetical protein [Paenibacillus whitsoniae]RTE05492.1 hypothetical protein EJQ19_25045 [Paenibacillus whitsoniae]